MIRTIGHKIGLLLVSFAAVITLSPPLLQTWRYQDEVFIPFSMPSHISPILPKSEADLDLDGSAECLRLTDQQASILKAPCDQLTPETPIAWQSPKEWQVIQAHIADFNRDSIPEVSLLVWREFRPWFIDRYLPHPGRIDSFHNEQNQSCHVILIGFRRGAYGELWAGSAMADPLLAFLPADVDGNGREELIALESRYTDSPGKPARALTAWEWNGFGFTLLAREMGAFRLMQAVSDPSGRIWIITQR